MNGCQRIAMEVRFLSYVMRLPSGCMIWIGGRSKGGKGREGREARGGPYGSFNIGHGYGSKRAHVVWAWIEGRIPTPYVPDGYHLDHQCDGTTLCVSCTTLIRKEENLALSCTRRQTTSQRLSILKAADRARKELLASRSRKKRKRVTRKTFANSKKVVD